MGFGAVPFPGNPRILGAMARTTYTGILARKIPNLGPLSAPGTTLLGETAADRAFDAEVDKRLTALFAHYGIEPQLTCPKGAEAEAVWDLMIELARAHVPGFKRERTRTTKRKVGRPLGRIAKQSLNERTIFRAVERLRRENPKLSVRAACAELHRRDRKTYGLETPDALRRRYKAYATLIGLTRKDIDQATKQSLRERLA